MQQCRCMKHFRLHFSFSTRPLTPRAGQTESCPSTRNATANTWREGPEIMPCALGMLLFDAVRTRMLEPSIKHQAVALYPSVVVLNMCRPLFCCVCLPHVAISEQETDRVTFTPTTADDRIFCSLVCFTLGLADRHI